MVSFAVLQQRPSRVVKVAHLALCTVLCCATVAVFQAPLEQSGEMPLEIVYKGRAADACFYVENCSLFLRGVKIFVAGLALNMGMVLPQMGLVVSLVYCQREVREEWAVLILPSALLIPLAIVSLAALRMHQAGLVYEGTVHTPLLPPATWLLEALYAVASVTAACFIFDSCPLKQGCTDTAGARPHPHPPDTSVVQSDAPREGASMRSSSVRV